MKTILEKPSWYPLEIYSKRLKPEEFLDEIIARADLYLALLEPIAEENAKLLFEDTIINGKNRRKMSEKLVPLPHHPVKPPSTFEIIYHYMKVKRALDNNNSSFEDMEKLANTMLDNNELTVDQKNFTRKLLMKIGILPSSRSVLVRLTT